jgi:hypothetical protein
MKRWEQKIVLAGLAIAGVVFLIAGVRPALGDGSLNVTFLLVGLACSVLGAVALRRSRVPPEPR